MLISSPFFSTLRKSLVDPPRKRRQIDYSRDTDSSTGTTQSGFVEDTERSESTLAPGMVIEAVCDIQAA